MKYLTWLRTILSVVFLSLLFSACGGGGAGNPFGNDSPGFSASQDSISFSARQDEATPSAVSITLTVSGGTVFFRDPVRSGSVVSSANLTLNGGNTATLNIFPAPPYQFVNPGTYTGSVTVEGCTDQFCNSGPDAGSVTINVTYTVEAGLSLSLDQNFLRFTSFEGVAPSAQTVNLTWENGVPPNWSAYDAQGGAFLTITPDVQANTLTVSPTAQPIGTYTSTLYIRYNLMNGLTRDVPISVEYSVGQALSGSGSVAFSLDETTTTGDLSKAVSISSNSGAAIAWNASLDVDWATVSLASGDTVTNSGLDLVLNQNKMDSIPSGTHTATLTITPTDPIYTPISVPVTVNMNLPRINFTGPAVILSGTADTVIVRGSGFTGVTSDVLIDNNPAGSVSVVSDTELQVGLSALNAGVYPVELDVNTGIFNRFNANLKVIDAVIHSYAAVAETGAHLRLIHDAQRDAVYVLDRSTLDNRVKRFRLINTSWTVDSLVLTDAEDMALAPGNDRLIVTTDAGLVHIDLDSFTITKTVVEPFSAGDRFTGIAFSNTGLGLLSVRNPRFTGFTPLYFYNIVDDSFTRGRSYYGISLGASRDGSRVIFGEGGITSPDVFYYDASTGIVNNTLLTTGATKVVIDRRATRSIHTPRDVYGSTFMLQGSLGNSVVARTISDDGTRAYVLRTDNAVYIYDLTAPSGTGFTQVGAAITLTDLPGGSLPQIAISIDGNTLYIIGNASFIIQPVP